MSTGNSEYYKIDRVMILSCMSPFNPRFRVDKVSK